MEKNDGGLNGFSFSAAYFQTNTESDFQVFLILKEVWLMNNWFLAKLYLITGSNAFSKLIAQRRLTSLWLFSGLATIQNDKNHSCTLCQKSYSVPKFGILTKSGDFDLKMAQIKPWNDNFLTNLGAKIQMHFDVFTAKKKSILTKK